MFGLQLLGQMGVDLQDRIYKGKVLGAGELERLVDGFSWQYKCLQKKSENSLSLPNSKRILSFESVRKSDLPSTDFSHINPGTAATRLAYFRDFLKWKIDQRLFVLPTKHEHYNVLREAKDFVIGAINSRMPSSIRTNDLHNQQGLTSEELEMLLELVKLNSSDNPWSHQFVRVRNRLIVHLLLKLGLRKGELLGIKVSDMNFSKNELTVHRRADDFEDPRTIQPNAKTKARILFIDSEFASALHVYVVKYRSSAGHSKQHPFLFVANGSGAPMSIPALNVVFANIKNKFPLKFGRLSAHILRHTWNDKFSELADREGVAEAKEIPAMAAPSNALKASMVKLK